LYNATQQTPRSDQELIDFYGYERRQVIRYSVFEENKQSNAVRFLLFIYRLILVIHVTVMVQASVVLRFNKAPNLTVHDLFVGVVMVHVLNHAQKIE